MDIMNISTIILSQNQNFKNLKHGFVEERVMITTTVTSSCQWKTLVPSFLLANDLRNVFNTNMELSQNRAEKRIVPFKTTVNWLFNDI